MIGNSKAKENELDILGIKEIFKSLCGLHPNYDITWVNVSKHVQHAEFTFVA